MQRMDQTDQMDQTARADQRGLLQRAALQAAVIMTVCGSALGTVWMVPADVPTIQGAINLAANDDEIIVSPGTYNEVIDFLGKRLHVLASGEVAETVIDASGIDDAVVSFQNNENSSSIIEGFTLTGGTGSVIGSFRRGGGVYVDGAEPVIRTCDIVGNSADEGGGIYVGGSIFLMQVANCALRDNTAAAGAGMFADFSNPVLRNCTISRNTINDSFMGAGSNGAGLFADNSTVRVANTIIWGNTPDTMAGTTPIVTYSDIEGGFPGSTNVDVNPQFEDFGGSDLRLSLGSPCIDVADSGVVADDVFVDLTGGSRGVNDPFAVDTGIAVFGLVVDMGAYERQNLVVFETCIGDINGDSEVSFLDLLEVLAHWGVCP